MMPYIHLLHILVVIRLIFGALFKSSNFLILYFTKMIEIIASYINLRSNVINKIDIVKNIDNDSDLV